jgi:hypothetical protein
MFIALARLFQSAGANDLHSLQQVPAIQLSRWLDEIWYNDSKEKPGQGLGGPMGEIREALGHPQPTGGGTPIQPSGIGLEGLPNPLLYTDKRGSVVSLRAGELIWSHLIYSYLVEATGAFDIFAEVARRLIAGESLGVLSKASIVWLRNTEELFFRDPPLFSVAGVVSDLRPSPWSNRRNAYWRMFGMDLPHQVPSGWPTTPPPDAWKQHTAAGVNSEFQEKLIELLRQVWLGTINAANTTGPNPSDAAYVALLCEAIRDMLHSRRQNGLLAREEFVYVSFMSWFHLTLIDGRGADQNAPIVRDLQAQGASAEQRLNSLATKVGMRAAPRSRELFQLSERMSVLLRAIELGAYNTEAQARLLFTDPDVRVIISHWQSATGQRIKDPDSVGRTAAMQPFRAPSPVAVSTPSNGSRQGH